MRATGHVTLIWALNRSQYWTVFLLTQKALHNDTEILRFEIRYAKKLSSSASIRNRTWAERLRFGSRQCGAIPPLPICFHGIVFNNIIKYRDNFNCTLYSTSASTTHFNPLKLGIHLNSKHILKFTLYLTGNTPRLNEET